MFHSFNYVLRDIDRYIYTSIDWWKKLKFSLTLTQLTKNEHFKVQTLSPS